MSSGRVNSRALRPTGTWHNGRNTPTSSRVQEQSQSTRSREAPRRLDELLQHRNILLQSQNPVAVRMGEALAEAHRLFENGQMTQDEHRDHCALILEAAEILAGWPAVDNAVLQRLNLHALTLQNHVLTEREYLAVCDDLKVQFDSEAGIAASRVHAVQGERSSERGRARLQNALRQATPSRVSGALVSDAIRAIQAGTPLEQAMQYYSNIQHPDDLAAMRQADRER